MYILLILLLFKVTLSYNLCIVGISSGLGREIAYQAITEKNLKVLGLSKSLYPIYKPFRGIGLEETQLTDMFVSENLKIDLYHNSKNYYYDHIVFCTSGYSFKKDYSDKITKKILDDLPYTCKSISLVSAAGVNKKTNNPYLELMKITSLKDIYRAKKIQEKLIYNFDDDICKFIYRPTLLSYGISLFDSTTRFELARKILNNINKVDL